MNFQTFFLILIIIINFQNKSFGQYVSSNCFSNTFWGLKYNNINNNYDVYEFILDSNVIVSSGISASGCTNISLGYYNSQNNSLLSNTFYSNFENPTTFQNEPSFFNNTTWSLTGIIDSLNLYHCAASRNDIYYIGGNGISFSRKILKFNGINIFSIYQTPVLESIAVADLAVDFNENIWFFTRSDSLPFFANKLNVIDSTGQLLAQYNTWFDITSAYGLSIIGDTLYIGFGLQNSIYPNSLVSVILNNNLALLNNVISMPVFSTTAINYDLASCNPGVPVGFKDYHKRATERLKAYPNPASESITIAQIPNEAKELVMLNSLGAMVYSTELQHQNQLNLEVSQFPPGMYAVCVYTPTEAYMVKWIKSFVK